VNQALSGLLVVDKPAAMTSHDVVARVRRVAGTRKVGHAGTLDPMATGVLLLGIGRATRLLGHLTLAEKTYDATVRLGLSTTTDDAEGEPLRRTSATDVAESDVRAVLAGLVGEIDQVPSTVSAVKVGGRRSYERARAGEEVELAPRRVTIHELGVHDVRRVEDDLGVLLDVDLTVRCSSGTYVRAVARDLGATLEVGGHLTRLRRTRIGGRDRGVALADAATLESLGTVAGPDEVPLLTMGEAARRFFTCVSVGPDEARAVGHGRRLHLHPDPPEEDPVAVLDPDGALLALYRRTDTHEDGSHAPLAVLV
jgi:tRNA pseudouridine55 synthase